MERGTVKQAFLKFHNILFYGGVTKEQYERVKDDVFNYNRNVVIIYSAVCAEIFLVLTFITFFTDSVISKNKVIYLIAASVDCMRKAFGKYGDIFRVGGDEFIAVLHLDQKQTKDAIYIMNNLISEHNNKENDCVSISLGCSSAREESHASFEELVHSADVKMYQNKSDYYKQTGKDRRQ